MTGDLAHRLLRHGYAELRRLRRIRGPHRRTAQRVAEAQGLVALAVLLSGGLPPPPDPLPPTFLNSRHPFGLVDLGPAEPVRIALVDLDADGDLDAVTSFDGDLYFQTNLGTRRRPFFGNASSDGFGLQNFGDFAVPAFADFLDADGDLDLLVGIPAGTTQLAVNTGTPAAPSFAVAQVNFPVSVGPFSAPAFGDLDGDGDLDLLMGDYNGDVTFFENTGTAAVPAFGPPVPDFLPPIGLISAPALADLDGDGDLDAWVGFGAGPTVLYENTGTATTPAFAAGEADPFGLEPLGLVAGPAFGDLDDDGDLDLLIGDNLGATHFFENTGNRQVPAFRNASRPFGLSSQSTRDAIALGDLDGDGDLDELTGAPTGNISFAPNTGTASSPSFGGAATDPFGLPAIADAQPALGDLDGDGDLDVLIGHMPAAGELLLYENTGSATEPAFAAAQTNPFCATALGPRPSPDFLDTDGDGDLDLVITYADGTVSFCVNEGSTSAPAFEPPIPSLFGLPNLGANATLALGELVVGNFLPEAIVGSGAGDLRGAADLDGPGIALELFDAAPAGLPDVGADTHPVLADLDDDGDLDVMVGFGIPVNIGRRAYFENLTIDPLCAPAPRTLCAEFSSGSFKVDERKQGKEKLALSLTGGPLLRKDALADPVADPEVAYALCIYDAEGARVATLEVDRFDDICGEKPCWSETAKGFRYADDSTSEDGILAIVLKAGAPGRSKLTLAAANNSKKSHVELATGLAGELADTTAVTVQVQSSGGACYSRTFSELRQQTPTLFKAR